MEKKKTGVNSKMKGSTFERGIAKKFTEWWNKGGLVGEFYRTPASGGLRWLARDDVIGDLCTPEGFGFIIECKNQEAWDFKELFQQVFLVKKPDLIKKGKNKGKPRNPRGLADFWYQACDEARRAGKEPLLVFTRNHYKVFVMYSVESEKLDAYTALLRVMGSVTRRVLFEEEDLANKFLRIGVMELDVFLGAVSPSSLKKEKNDPHVN